PPSSVPHSAPSGDPGPLSTETRLDRDVVGPCRSCVRRGRGGPCPRRPRPRTPTGASLVVYPWKSGVAAVAYGNSDTGAILAETVEPDSESMRSLRAHRQGQVVRRRKGFRFSHARR